MTVLDLIVIVTAILFFVRWKRSKLVFIVWLFERGFNKYVIKGIYMIFLLGYTLYALIVRVDLSFLTYRIF
jgi:hypothetical protein